MARLPLPSPSTSTPTQDRSNVTLLSFLIVGIFVSIHLFKHLSNPEEENTFIFMKSNRSSHVFAVVITFRPQYIHDMDKINGLYTTFH